MNFPLEKLILLLLQDCLLTRDEKSFVDAIGDGFRCISKAWKCTRLKPDCIESANTCVISEQKDSGLAVGEIRYPRVTIW